MRFYFCQRLFLPKKSFRTLKSKGRNKYIELFNLLRRIWTKKFDIVISSGSNKFISIFLFMTFIKERIGYNSGRLSEKLLTHAVQLNKNQYAAKMYHDLVKPLTDNITELPEINIEPRKTEPDSSWCKSFEC